jgi:hypothetical protein
MQSEIHHILRILGMKPSIYRDYAVEPILRIRTTSGGIPLWAVGDPAHLAADAYREMAEALLDGDRDLESANSSATVASGYKRKRPKAVITTPAPSAYNRGRVGGGKRPAGWLVGRPDVTAPSSDRGGKSWRGDQGHGWNRGELERRPSVTATVRLVWPRWRAMRKIYKKQEG